MSKVDPVISEWARQMALRRLAKMSKSARRAHAVMMARARWGKRKPKPETA